MKKKKKEYNFPQSLRYCYVCEKETIFTYTKKIGHSVCNKCKCPGINQTERKMLGLKNPKYENS